MGSFPGTCAAAAELELSDAVAAVAVDNPEKRQVFESVSEGGVMTHDVSSKKSSWITMVGVAHNLLTKSSITMETISLERFSCGP